MAFTDAERVDIRRYCGYDLFGSSSNSFFGDRYFTVYGKLEYRMTFMTPQEEAVVRTVYLQNLSDLESAIPNVSQNLDTNQAAVWYWNTNELRDREKLFNSWRIKLCDFMGIPPGNGIRNLNQIRITV